MVCQYIEPWASCQAVGKQTHVADTNGANLAGIKELLHGLPGVDVGEVAEDVTAAIGLGGEPVVVSCEALMLVGQ